MKKIFSLGSSSKEPSDLSQYTPSMAVRPNITGPPRPIRFVYRDENGKFRIDPEAVATLQLVKEPVGVVAICGPSRQGKSYILNQLLGRSSGFQVSSEHRPCTKGLWLWSAPIRRKTLDGSEYNLLLLDSEGINASDQSATYSTQIFSLAVLLSSMFVYNQMGAIDQTVLGGLSLVSGMTKHIRARATGGKNSAIELGQFSPKFVLLIRDFYFNLVEDNKRVTPRDFLEGVLSPVHHGEDKEAKNEIRDSIRALFPDRECFALVRPLNSENELQRLDQIPLTNLRPEFQSGLDAFTKYVFERTKPKEVGAAIMTGPILVCVTESYVDAFNKGAVPSIVSSWQSVEESVCRRAFDVATEIYMSSFDRSKPPEEGALREAHEVAAHKSVESFNADAIAAGSVRQKYEKHLNIFLRKAFEDYKKNVYMEADRQCSDSIQIMEKKLREACLRPDAKINEVIKVLNNLICEYEASSHGPGKWKKLTKFLEYSLEGPVVDLIRKCMDQIGSEKSSLMLKCRSIEDRMGLLQRQLDSSEKQKSEYIKRYEDAINEKKNASDEYMNRIASLQSDYSSMAERHSSLVKTLDAVGMENSELKRKYEQALSKESMEEEKAKSLIAVLKSRSTAAEARLEAAKELATSAKGDAKEWKRRYEFAVKESRSALEKAAIVQERANNQMQQREDELREEFGSTLAVKEDELNTKNSKIKQAEQRLTTMFSQLNAAESKINSYEAEVHSMSTKITELSEKLASVSAKAQEFKREARTAEQEKAHLEEKYESEFRRFDEVQERCRVSEKEAKRATELADTARAEAASAQKENKENLRVAMKRQSQIERAERHMENLERQKAELGDELERVRVSEMEALAKVGTLESRVEEREREIEDLLKVNNEQRVDTVQVLENLLEIERKARAEANFREEALSVRLQTTQGRLDSLQQELTAVRLNETALDSKLKTAGGGKRSRLDDEMEVDGANTRSKKRSGSPFMYRNWGDSESEQTQSASLSADDYTKFTVQKLKQELTKHDAGAELLQLRTPNKKDLLALYEKRVLHRS